jgi:hypothetical protein
MATQRAAQILTTLLTWVTLASAGTLTGVVRDGGGQPLAGVLVSLSGGLAPGVTDARGAWAAQAPEGATVRVSPS